MSAQRSARWTRGSAFRAGFANPQMRVSDAERAEVADRLSKHYSDGRLDQAEFNERLDRAMRAKTQADLSGIFTDLPVIEEPGKPEKPEKVVRQRDGRPRNGRPLRRTVGLILIVVVAIIVAHALTPPFLPFFWPTWSPVTWLLIGLIVFLWLRHGPGRRP